MSDSGSVPKEQQPAPKEAGRELDALVAERVMGWEVVWHPCYRSGDDGSLCSSSDAEKEKHPCRLRCACDVVTPDRIERYGGTAAWVEGTNHSWHCVDPVPEYSEYVSAAWSVVEKMRELGWCFTLSIRLDGYWVAAFQRGAGSPTWDSRREEGAPLAICLAALTAAESQQLSRGKV